MYMCVIMCIYVYGPVAVNTINELNWIELNRETGTSPNTTNMSLWGEHTYACLRRENTK